MKLKVQGKPQEVSDGRKMACLPWNTARREWSRPKGEARLAAASKASKVELPECSGFVSLFFCLILKVLKQNKAISENLILDFKTKAVGNVA